MKVWSIKVKIAKTITESGCVTITDEAFTQMALENYWGVGSTNKPSSGLTRGVETNSIWAGVMKPMNAMMTFAGDQEAVGHSKLKGPRT